MATDQVSRDRLQPALLDRLTDFAPQERNIEAPELRTLTRARLRQLVLRDLTWLMNAPRGFNEAEQARYPGLSNSTLNFGIVPLSGKLASGVELHELEGLLRQAIIDFEPRILAALLFAGSFVPRTMFEEARQVTIPLQVLLQWDDEGNDRQMALDLFDAFGTKEKTLHANMGGHTGVPQFEGDDGNRFFARHLK